MPKSLLIVDDEQDMLHLLKRSLAPDLGCRIATASSGKEALDTIAADNFDLVLADIKMPGMGGLELLDMIKKRYPDMTVVMMTAFGQTDTAVEAMKHGAYDFITKPFDHEALVVRLEKALERSSLLKENLRLKMECRGDSAFQEIIGKTAIMQRLFETIKMVANTDLTVLITGESGTGKDLTGKAIHALSPRRHGPYVSVNCPTVPEQILESELFGYRKGAFTHATHNKVGLFQEADGGTIFLDEIGDISPTIQTKLLRVLQEKEIKPLGSPKTIGIDVRIIASTNQDLTAKMREKEFREDFFYRLNVLPVQVPPLRERQEDIPLIANHLLEKHCAQLNKPMKRISKDLMDAFLTRHWEGNIREMENIILQGIMFSSAEEIRPGDVGFDGTEDESVGIPDTTQLRQPYKEAKEMTLRQFNSAFIGRLLTQNGGNVTQAARQCGLERQALQQIMRRYGIKADDYRK